jgi:hypothetical protein
MGRSKERTWTDEQLAAAVASSTTYRMVLRKLGLRNGSLGYLQAQIERRGLETSHLEKAKSGKRCSDDELQAVVRGARTATEILDALGIEHHSNSFVWLRKRIALRPRHDSLHTSSRRPHPQAHQVDDRCAR